MRTDKEKLKMFKNMPKSLMKPNIHCCYGPSGFRGESKEISSAICRLSLVSQIRSSTLAGKVIGMVITASHNEASDNGVKIIDHTGDMLDSTWESVCTEIMNCENDELLASLNKVQRKYGKIGEFGTGVRAKLVIGRDTRESGEEIVNEIKTISELLDCEITDYGVVSTPQLHFLVRSSNQNRIISQKNEYMDSLSLKFNELSELMGVSSPEVLMVDTANGVPYIILKEFLQKSKLQLHFLNGNGVVNKNCGAAFIKEKNKLPAVESLPDQREKISEFSVSFDGDMDRLLYYTHDKNLIICDGDRQCLILAEYFHSLLEKSGEDIKIGVVLSAYSNSAAVSSLRGKFPIQIAPTGIKFFVKQARDYDIGIYFEPNGHGGVTFNPSKIKKYKDSTIPELKILYRLLDIFDPSIGDAFANFLVFHLIFQKVSINEYFKYYTNNPTRLINVKIGEQIEVDENGNVISPNFLAKKINDIKEKINGRVYIRPSATEPLVRVFTESSTQEKSDQLALMVSQEIYDECKGYGEMPEISYCQEFE